MTAHDPNRLDPDKLISDIIDQQEANDNLPEEDEFGDDYEFFPDVIAY